MHQYRTPYGWDTNGWDTMRYGWDAMHYGWGTTHYGWDTTLLSDDGQMLVPRARSGPIMIIFTHVIYCISRFPNMIHQL